LFNAQLLTFPFTDTILAGTTNTKEVAMDDSMPTDLVQASPISALDDEVVIASVRCSVAGFIRIVLYNPTAISVIPGNVVFAVGLQRF
jgi:hypothetical protein